MTVPPLFEPPFDALQVPIDVLLCAEPGCGFASVHATSMRGHCNRTHAWQSTATGSMHWTAVNAQKFFTTSALQRYFAVLGLGEIPQREEGQWRLVAVQEQQWS